MDVGVNSSNMQIATMHINKLVEFYRGDDRRPSLLSHNRGPRVGRPGILRADPYALYAQGPRGLVCHLGLPPLHEGRKDYKGGIVWHEGEFRFKKDCTLQGAVPIPLLQELAATDVSKMAGTAFVVSDPERCTRIAWCVRRTSRKP